MKRYATLLLLVPMLGISRPARAQTIFLLPESTVDTPQVTLAQIARVVSPTDGEADAAAKVVVQASPAIGARATINLADLRDKLSELGVNRATWTIQGSAACVVTRVPGAAEQIAQLQERSEKMQAGLVGTMAAVPQEIIPESLAGAIGLLLEKQFQPPGGKLTLQFEPADRSVLALQRPDYRFELAIKRVSEKFIDVAAHVYAVKAPAKLAGAGPEIRQAVRGKSADVLVKSIDIRVHADLSAPVVVVKQAVNLGQTISGDDVQLGVRPIGLNSSVVRELSAVVGQQAKRMLKSEETIGPADLAPMALVHRNKLVTVWLRNGGLLVKTVGRAMQEGVFGEKVLVRNEASHQPFYGVVSGPDTVELDPTAVPDKTDAGTRGHGDAGKREKDEGAKGRVGEGATGASGRVGEGATGATN